MHWERVACLLTEGLKADGGPYDGDVANAVPLYLKWLSAGPPDVGSQTRHALELVRSGMEPAEAGRRVWEQSGRRAAGNGSLMRTAPIGVLLAGEPGRLQEASLRDSAVTHFDPRCQLACAAFNAAKRRRDLCQT
jgi:ADP-ribosyl-[dinitrogen reductase] hydrolase